MILDIFSFVKEILYINSSLYPDRLQNLADQFAKIGINIKTDSRCKKIEAYYPLENEIPIFFKGKIGHYGCIVSHSMAYKYIAESSYSDNNNYLIVEDDITINNNFLFIFTIIYINNIYELYSQSIADFS